MSEQWQGLHNPNQHKRYKDECRCVGCGDYEWCASEYPCRCCLAAEVETLREQVTSDGVRCAKCEGVPAEIGGFGVLDCYRCVVRERDALAVDVEALRRIRESQIEDIIALRYDLEVAREAQATIDALKAQVQRVERLLDRCDQDTYDFHWGEGSPVVLTQYVRDALDGGEPDE